MMASTHVVVQQEENGEYWMRCLHCRQTYKISLPAPIGSFVAIFNEFGNQHRDYKNKTNKEAECEK